MFKPPPRGQAVQGGHGGLHPPHEGKPVLWNHFPETANHVRNVNYTSHLVGLQLIDIQWNGGGDSVRSYVGAGIVACKNALSLIDDSKNCGNFAIAMGKVVP